MPKSDLDARLRVVLDAIDEPVSIATAIRDRDGRILDFRLAFVNQAAVDWAGLPREGGDPPRRRVHEHLAPAGGGARARLSRIS